MKQIEQFDRNQIQMMSIDMMVADDSIARVLDVFLDFAEEYDLGFRSSIQNTGRPAFPTRTLLGIYIYGYLHKTRSSRDLEKACQNNIELIWLIKGHKPCYKTIANFRKDNRAAFRKLFNLYRDFCNTLELFGKQTIAIDGSKFRAQNAKKNNFNLAKINRQLEYIQNKQSEYLNSLDQEDKKHTSIDSSEHLRLQHLAKQKDKYEQLREKLNNSDSTQISTSDPDSRAMPLHMNIVEVAYNVQSAVDDKNYLIADFEVTNEKDNNALAPMAIKTKQALAIPEQQSLTVLADKGYFKGQQFQMCHDHQIETLVAVKDLADKSKPAHVTKDKFIYNPQSNNYTCPQGHTLTHQARYNRRKDKKVIAQFDRYAIKHSICVKCKFYHDCISSSKQKNSQGRYIDRPEYQNAIDRNTQAVNERKEEYRKRQAIVEHPFGSIKRAWGFTYTLMKTIPRVETEFSIIFLCYNLRRTMSILGLDKLKSALIKAIYSILQITCSIVADMLKLFYPCYQLSGKRVYFY